MNDGGVVLSNIILVKSSNIILFNALNFIYQSIFVFCVAMDIVIDQITM